MKRAALVVGLVVFAWLIWDTGADPIGLVRGLPWIFDFFRRMFPPDLAVLPSALLGAVRTVEIALLGTAVAAVVALPLGFLSARNVAAPAVFYPARSILNFFRSVPEAAGLPMEHLLMAASVMTIMPIIVLFFLAQRYFVQGIALTGLKG